ncbi:MAG: hypothetical protein NC131_21945 [Roseburia sp.]|nr:hypothetical protein [Roseburia sp.]
MYAVETYQGHRLLGTALYEKLENALYEAAHPGKGLYDMASEASVEKAFAKPPRALILNDCISLKFSHGISARIRKAVPADTASHETHLLYAGTPETLAKT